MAGDQPLFITGSTVATDIHTTGMAIMMTSTLIYPTDRIARTDPTAQTDPAFNRCPAGHRAVWDAPPAACPEAVAVEDGAANFGMENSSLRN